MSSKTAQRQSMLPKRSRNAKEGFQSRFTKARNSNVGEAQELRNHIPANTIEAKIPTKISLYKVPITNKLFSQRSVPKELSGRPKIIGNENQTESLFNYTKKIAQSIFTKNNFKILFPSFFKIYSNARLSFLSTSSMNSTFSNSSRIPIKRKSSILPDSDLSFEDSLSPEEASMSKQFEFLSKVLENKKEVMNIPDFLLLYVASVIAVCNNNEATSNALHFLLKFLELGATRKDEVNILFAVLLRACDTAPDSREDVIKSLAKLAELETSLQDRLENGSTHRDVQLSSLCNDVLKKLGKQSSEKKEKFVSISENANEEIAIEMLGKYVETLEDNGQPSDIIDFIRNITSVMMKFKDSAMILERSASCIESVIPFCSDVPLDSLFQDLSICFSILSEEMFLNGEMSFMAVESIEKLTKTIFNSVNPKILLSALASVVAQADGIKLQRVLQYIDQYVANPPDTFTDDMLSEIYENMEIFHPSIQYSFSNIGPNIDIIENYERSINRLCNPETIFEELDKIISESPDGNFKTYPSYLRPILQSAFLIKNQDNSNINFDEIDEIIFDNVKTTINEINSIEDDKLEESRFGPDGLRKELDTVLQNINQEEIEEEVEEEI